MLAKTRTITDIAKDIAANKAKQDALAKQVKTLEDLRTELDKEFMNVAETQGDAFAKAGIKGVGSVGIVESVVPQAADWDSFYKFIKRNNYFHLLERRPSVTGCREMWELGKAVPGIEKFTKRKVQFTPEK